MFTLRIEIFALLGGLLLMTGMDVSAEGEKAPRPQALPLRSGDRVGFLGGANVVDALQGGHLESLLTFQFPQEAPIFRNLGWEGDTVYSQPREVNFPSLTNRLAEFGITCLFVEFGQIEALEGTARLNAFTVAYERWLDPVLRSVPRTILVTPSAYEAAGPLLPDLTQQNPVLRQYAKAIQNLGRKRGLLVVDLSEEPAQHSSASARLTSDGLHRNPAGHASIALVTAKLIGLDKVDRLKLESNASGEWNLPEMERLRQAIISKNKLWFRYSRPMNWAFLGGDRTEQPSSRDHRDPKIRWFPDEMKQFLPLIYRAESDIHELARKAAGSP